MIHSDLLGICAARVKTANVECVSSSSQGKELENHDLQDNFGGYPYLWLQ